LLSGHGDKVLEWAQTDWTKQSPASYFFLIDVPELTKIRIMVGHGTDLQAAEALCVLAEVEAFLDSIHNKYHGIDIELLKAMALLRISRKELAKKSLKKALLLSEKDDSIRPIMEAYRVMPSLFDLVVQDRNFRRLLSRIGIKSSSNELALVSYSKSDEISLREKEVIRLIAAGLQNKEVANKLNISTVTVKSHLTNVYRKLEVPNRTSMLRVAKERRILK
jgi:DNA-binding CsgD family transcriptional regulator